MLKLPLLLLVLAGTCAAQNDHPLTELQGNARIMIVFSPDANGARFKRQLELIEHHNYELTERNTVVVPVAPLAPGATEQHFIGENLMVASSSDQASVRSRFHVQPGDFLVILVNPDGTEQSRSLIPVNIHDLVAHLDAMPKH